MACGKTTFGRALARRLGLEFIDLDFYIEQRFRKSINEIFHDKGEEEFRRIEASMLREVGEFENVIISCGGGTPCFHSNMDYMLDKGDVVWLQASVDRITQRLLINSSRRPLMKGKCEEEIRQAVLDGLAQRETHYNRANIHFASDELEDRRQIDNTVEKFLLTPKISQIYQTKVAGLEDLS
ncbi:MAG: shikimate kinase [Muribaculaceae bacterium]|nr:shikimate kinase [Muribaculaceae bacterium]